MKTGIFYGSTTGTTESVAKRLGGLLGVADADIHNVAESAPSDVADYDLLVLGTSTWGSGDLQDDWQDFIAGLEELSLRGKKIALFGVGDESMTDTFCNAVGTLYDRLKKTGAEFIGAFPDGSFTFKDSSADTGEGVAVGLLLDETNHADLTDSRLAEWAALLKK
nr:flavodoxin [Bacteroides sp.]